MAFGRGKLTTRSSRIKVVDAINEAIKSGARQFKACEVVGISERTFQRWRKQGKKTVDGRLDAKRPEPANKLTDEEKERIIQTMNQKENRNLPPSQVVYKLLDEEQEYIASVSTFYRVMHEYEQISHRGYSKAPEKREITTHKATGPNQVWMWDITWLPGPAKGVYYYLYMIMDLFSRKIVGWEIWKKESSEYASQLVKKAVYSENVLLNKQPLILHSDNGSPMKGASLLTTLYNLGIVRSNSRPRVSNDNPYIESLFRTVKYMPAFPHTGFKTLNKAREWTYEFVKYYNVEHRHSGLKYITPEQRHNGDYEKILENRKALLESARGKNPERWTKNIQSCELDEVIYLNPVRKKEDKCQEVI